jgi:hypothetical protein
MPFVCWVIAHELAYAHPRNTGRFPGDDPEYAADAPGRGVGISTPRVEMLYRKRRETAVSCPSPNPPAPRREAHQRSRDHQHLPRPHGNLGPPGCVVDRVRSGIDGYDTRERPAIRCETCKGSASLVVGRLCFAVDKLGAFGGCATRCVGQSSGMESRTLTTKQLEVLAAKLRTDRDVLLPMHGRAIDERWDEIVEPVQAASLAVGELVAMLERMDRARGSLYVLTTCIAAIR